MNVRSRNLYLGLSIGVAIVCAPAVATAARVLVNPGDSIQAAVDSAAPGDTIVVMAGTYQETHGGQNAVTVSKDNIRMVARARRGRGEKVIIMPGPGNENGIVVEPDPPATTIEGFRIRGFTVQDFPKHGIVTRHVNNFRIERNESINNLENGIFPTLSANGLVRRNVSYGSEDTALWVEASENVRVIRNELYNSPTGLEVTVSNNLVIRGNDVHGNATGIGLFHPSAASLDPIPVMANWRVEHNYVHDNNGPNNAPPGSMSADLPIGGGILVLGIDSAIVRNNRIENNDFYGIVVIDYCLAVLGSSFNCQDDPPAVESFPDNNVFLHNRFTGNATAPPAHPLAPLAADIVFVPLSGTGNCFKGNNNLTSSGDPLPGC